MQLVLGLEQPWRRGLGKAKLGLPKALLSSQLCASVRQQWPAFSVWRLHGTKSGKEMCLSWAEKGQLEQLQVSCFGCWMGCVISFPAGYICGACKKMYRHMKYPVDGDIEGAKRSDSGESADRNLAFAIRGSLPVCSSYTKMERYGKGVGHNGFKCFENSHLRDPTL